MAANSGVIHGGDIMLFVNEGTEQAPVWTPGAHATSHSISHSMSPREISSKDTGRFTLIKPGKHGVSTITIESLRCYDGFGYFDLKELLDADTKIAFKYSGRANGDQLETAYQGGDMYEKGTGYITALQSTDPHDNNATMSCTISIDGATTNEIQEPTVTATPSAQTIASGGTTAIALSSDISGTTFAWTVSQNGVTGASGGSGASIAQTLTRTGAPGTATYTITPTSNTVAGDAITVVVTVTA